MSTATFYPPPSLHVQIPVSSISPHLLHSPHPSPEAELQQYLSNYPMNAMNAFTPASQPTQDAYSPPDTSAVSTSTATTSSLPSTNAVVSQGGMVTVHSYTPSTGQPNTCITTYIDFSSNVQGPVRLRLVFADAPRPTVVEANINRLYTQTRGNWTLKAYVPSVDHVSVHLATTGPDGRLEWPLTIQALDLNNNVLDSVVFGVFSYDNYSNSPSPSSTYDYPSLPAKRPFTETAYPSLTPVKRAAVDDDKTNIRRLSGASDSQAYPSNVPMMLAPSNRTGTTISPQTLTQAMSLPSPSSLPKPFLNFSATGKRKRSRSNPVANSSTMNPSQTVPSNETTLGSLIRTSQLGNQMAEPAKVVLRQNLETMKYSWTEDELAANRRLVQFWKRQVGNRLEISFTAVPHDSYKENTIIVSCIYREDINDYFITSVDVIYLLESLSGGRFEVEEKNRIRRNLEGFKPLTVSKTKPGTEEFFRVIMEFPPPRPRNIEKDVKVFEWRKLKSMMDKVFSKYSTVSAGNFSSSDPMDTEEADLLESEYTDQKKFVVEDRDSDNSSNASAVGSRQSSSVDLGSHLQPKQEMSYPELSLGEIQKMNKGTGDLYSEGTWQIYDSSHMPGVNHDAPGVKAEYQSYSPLSLINDHNNNLGQAYDRLRDKSSPFCNHSPLSATMSISSLGSSENGFVNEVTDYTTPSFG